MDQPITDNNWHLKKEIPIATILTMVSAIAVGTWWISTLRSDIDLHWQAFQMHDKAEVDRLGEQRKGNVEVLHELKEIRASITQIKISLARQ